MQARKIFQGNLLKVRKAISLLLLEVGLSQVPPNLSTPQNFQTFLNTLKEVHTLTASKIKFSQFKSIKNSVPDLLRKIEELEQDNDELRIQL